MVTPEGPKYGELDLGELWSQKEISESGFEAFLFVYGNPYERRVGGLKIHFFRQDRQEADLSSTYQRGWVMVKTSRSVEAIPCSLVVASNLKLPSIHTKNRELLGIIQQWDSIYGEVRGPYQKSSILIAEGINPELLPKDSFVRQLIKKSQLIANRSDRVHIRRIKVEIESLLIELDRQRLVGDSEVSYVEPIE